MYTAMKYLSALLLVCGLALSAYSQAAPGNRKSLLDNEPGVVYLDQAVADPILLNVVRKSPVFSDQNGKNQIGTLAAGQELPLEAMTERAYRVRGKGGRNNVAGWVSPQAFSSKDPDFIAHLRQLFDRQIAVEQFIAAKQAAIGMSLAEVARALGKATKTTLRKTPEGETGSWEFIEFTTINHYTTEIDPLTRQAFRRFAYATQEEKSRTKVEFTNGVVSAIEETEDRQGGNVRIVVPPVIFGW